MRLYSNKVKPIVDNNTTDAFWLFYDLDACVTGHQKNPDEENRSHFDFAKVKNYVAFLAVNFSFFVNV